MRSKTFFNRQIDSLTHSRDSEILAKYYADYANTIEKMLDNPSQAQTIAGEFFNDERLDTLNYDVNKRMAVYDTVADASAFCIAVCAAITITSLIAAAVTGGLPIGIAALSVLGLVIALSIHLVAKDKKPVTKEFEFESPTPHTTITELAEFEEQHQQLKL